MLGFQTCLIVAAMAAPGDVELVKFTSQNCVPCQAMEPVLNQVRAQGYRVSQVDWDQQPDLAKRYQITAVPTLLVVSQGQIVDRIEGVVAIESLLDRLARIDHAGATNDPRAGQVRRDAGSAASDADQTIGDRGSEQAAMQASVRIRVEDPRGQSYGTGTIVDVHGQDALVLTCGHLFRDSAGKGRITIELLTPVATGPVTGQLIRFDLDRDLALVGIRTTVPIKAVPVAGAEYHVATGQRLFTVGCNHGQEATVMRGQLKAVNKYLGPENLVVSGMPVDGRSGGGLFSYDGKLVGVCNAADPEINEGLYAAFASIHRHLDDAKLSFIYRGTAEPTAVAIANTGATTESLPAIPAIATEREPLATGARGVEPAGAEVICIIRPKNGADASHVVVLERPSRDFIQQLNQEYNDQTNRQATQLRVARRLTPPAKTGRITKPLP